ERHASSRCVGPDGVNTSSRSLSRDQGTGPEQAAFVHEDDSTGDLDTAADLPGPPPGRYRRRASVMPSAMASMLISTPSSSRNRALSSRTPTVSGSSASGSMTRPKNKVLSTTIRPPGLTSETESS